MYMYTCRSEERLSYYTTVYYCRKFKMDNDNQEKSINYLGGNQIKQFLFMNTFKRLQEISTAEVRNMCGWHLYNSDSLMEFLRHLKYRSVAQP